MLTRRKFLAASSLLTGAALAASNLPYALASDRGVALYIQDPRLRTSGQALPKPPRGAKLLTIEGDVSRSWFEVIRPHITHSRAPIFGMTQEDALFCLRTLAQDHGWQLQNCQALQQHGQSSALGLGCSHTALTWMLSPAYPV